MKPDFFGILARAAVAPGGRAASGRPEASAGSGAGPATPVRPPSPAPLPRADPGASTRTPPPRDAAPARPTVAAPARARAVRTPPKLDLGSYLDRRRGRP